MLFPELFCDDIFHIETRRLWLRWPKAGDARALQRIAGIAAVAEMTATWPHPLPEGEADKRILRARQANLEGKAIVLAIVRKREPREFIGMVGLHVEGGSGRGMLGLGYMLEPAFHGRGLMSEAVGALVAAGFGFTTVECIVASCLPVNPASRRVLEKCGFEHVGDSSHQAPARAGPQVCQDFALSRGRWLMRQVAGGIRGEAGSGRNGRAA